MYLLYNHYVGTDFNKSSGEDTFESSSTMKVVDQKSIRQRNSKPISRETQSNQHKHSKSVGKKNKKKNKKTKKKFLKNMAKCSGKEAEEKSLLHHWLRSFYGGPNGSRETQFHLY